MSRTQSTKMHRATGVRAYRSCEAWTEADVRRYVVAFKHFSIYRVRQFYAKAAYIGISVVLLWIFAALAPVIAQTKTPPFERVTAAASAVVICSLWLLSQRAVFQRSISILPDQRSLLHSETQNSFAFCNHHTQALSNDRIYKPSQLDDDHNIRHFVRDQLEAAIAPVAVSVFFLGVLAPVLAFILSVFVFIFVSATQVTSAGPQHQWLVLLPTVAVTLYLGGRVAKRAENRVLLDIDQKYREVLAAWSRYRVRKLLHEDFEGFGYQCKNPNCKVHLASPPFKFDGVCRNCFARNLSEQRLHYLKSAAFLVFLAFVTRAMTWSGQPSLIPLAIGLLLFLFFSNGLWQDYRRWVFCSEEDNLDNFVDRDGSGTSAT